MSQNKATTDAELARQFAAGRDQRAFAELVARHGPMVRAVGWRVLRCEQDAEDVLQATFLAFAASAERIRNPGAIGAWLHETALRSAKRLLKTNIRWKQVMREKAQESSEAYDASLPDDLQEVIDDELRRLPRRLRLAVVICDLEGKSRKAAASQLGLPITTLQDHLTLGRRQLCDRLKRRGVACSLAGLAAALGRAAEAAKPVASDASHTMAGQAARFAAGAPAEQVGVSVNAFELTQRVLRAMMIAKTSTVAAAAALLLFVGGGLTGVVQSVARGGTILVEDFSKGDVGWSQFDSSVGQPWGPGVFDTSDGDYYLHTTGVVTGGAPGRGFLGATWAESDDARYSNGRVRAKVRLDTYDSTASVLFRWTGDPANGFDGYGFVMHVGPDAGFFFNQIESSNLGDGFAIVPSVTPQTGEEWWIEGGGVGDTLSMKVWRDGDPEPASPQITVLDSAYSRGRMGVVASMNLDSQTEGKLEARFDDVHFRFDYAPGDANGDGMVDLHDFNLLKDAFGTNDPFTDFDGNGVVDLADFNILKTNFGAAAAVPEPTAALLASLSGVGIVAGWRFRRRARRAI